MIHEEEILPVKLNCRFTGNISSSCIIYAPPFIIVIYTATSSYTYGPVIVRKSAFTCHLPRLFKPNTVNNTSRLILQGVRPLKHDVTAIIYFLFFSFLFFFFIYLFIYLEPRPPSMVILFVLVTLQSVAYKCTSWTYTTLYQIRILLFGHKHVQYLRCISLLLVDRNRSRSFELRYRHRLN